MEISVLLRLENNYIQKMSGGVLELERRSFAPFCPAKEPWGPRLLRKFSKINGRRKSCDPAEQLYWIDGGPLLRR